MKALFFQGPWHGHVNPSLPVTAELVRRGHEVIYYLTEEFRAAVEATGATFRIYPTMPDSLVNAQPGNPLKLTVTMIDACRDMLPGLIDRTLAEQPDVILYDSMAPWGGMIARHLHIPAVASMALLGLTPRVILKAGMLRTFLVQMLKNIHHVRAYNRKARALERDLGVTAPPIMESLNLPGDITLLYTSREFQPEASAFDERFKFIGPSIEQRPGSSDFPFERLNGKKLIYISLGTVNNDAPAFYRATFDAFRESPWQVVLSVGKRTDIESLGPIPDNFIVRNYVPQLEILCRSALFITHGGMNSVHEGLAFGVPLVVVPQTDEQNLVAKQVVRLGAGVILDKAGVDAVGLREAVGRVLSDDRYRLAAVGVGEGFLRAGGPGRGANEIEDFVRQSTGGLHARRDAVDSRVNGR